jgi:C-terminal processing protease CtpA/Prc
VVVIIDANTASAAETTAASLRDTVGARVVGTRSFGKGYAQVIHDLEDGTSIKVTNGIVQAPRTTWHGRGLAVDLGFDALAKRGKRALAQGRDREMSGAFVRPKRGDAIIAGALDEVRAMLEDR